MTDKVEEARKKFGRVVEVRDGEDVFAFRPANRATISDVRVKLAKDETGIQSLAILTNFCLFHCVVGKDKFAAYAEQYPLSVADGTDEPDGNISNAIFSMAKGDAKITVK
jgi:hypothetical protein